MIKSRKIKVKSIEIKEIIMAMTMTKAITKKIIVIIMTIMKIEIGNHIKIQKR